MSKNLQLRIIFGLLYAGFIFGMLYYGKLTAIILLVVFGLFMTFEFNKITQANRTNGYRIFMNIINIPLGIGVWFLLDQLPDIYPLLVISITYGLANVYSLFIKKTTLIKNEPQWFHMILYITLPIVIGILGCRWVDDFSMQLLYLFFIVWLCDVGAYFAGKAFGKRKLFEIVSPNKTWEGFYGGLIAGILTAIAIHYYSGLHTLGFWIIAGAFICMISVIGDLIESSFKRHFEIKDSSNIIPGHGGFLDRLDSFIFALPFYTTLIVIFAL
ncbi:MAG: phosphatidate cytidylyltransferase [Saprospiraceae bacterium]|nr:phosphatidate cytidylyltransferase [Saprospiraceae bacterium]|tara:strand:+ start:3729 stop:4541 length:813 start_codon:yes stop_codon:yes gene_type:complete